MKYTVEIPEIHKAIVDVELPEGSSREEILAAAKKVYEEEGTDILEYSDIIHDEDKWTTRTEKGDFVS
jgi:hypothetical protein